MPRARLLKPGFFKNEELARLSERHRLLYAGLWTLADREGRLEDRPARIKGELFPYEPVDIEPLLIDLARRGFIVRYSYDDPRGHRSRSHAIAIPTFLNHQTPHHREGKSSIPPPTSKRAHHSAPINGSPPANDQPKASLGRAQGQPDPSRTVYGDPVPVYGDPVTGDPETVPSPPAFGGHPFRGKGPPLKGSRRLKRNLAAAERAAAHIMARGKR